jgi:hypothetical protein
MDAERTKVVGGVVEGLKANPMVLCLLAINVSFLIGGAYTLHSIMDRVNEGSIRRDKLLTEIIQNCSEPRAKQP